MSQLFWPLVNFLLYFGLLSFVYRKYLASALYSRRIRIEEDLNNTAIELEHAVKELSEVRDRLCHLEAEKKAVSSRYSSEGEKTAELLIGNAIKTANSLDIETTQQIEFELSVAKNEIRKQVILRATDIVRWRLKDGLTKAQDNNLKQAVFRKVEQQQLT